MCLKSGAMLIPLLHSPKIGVCIKSCKPLNFLDAKLKLVYSTKAVVTNIRALVVTYGVLQGNTVKNNASGRNH